MPEIEATAAPVAAPDTGSSAPVDTSTTPAADPAPSNEPVAPSSEAAAPAPSDNSATNGQPAATDPQVVPDATPGETTPDHGINPDKGIDPDKGDEATPTPTQSAADDPSQMTEQQRASYYHQLRNRAKTTTETALNAQYQPEQLDAVAERLMGEGYDEFQAQMLAREEIREQEKELSNIRAEVAELNAGLATEAVEVVSTIPWLNPAQQEAYGDGKLADLASSLYEAFVVRDQRTAQRDQNGNAIPGTGTIIEAKLTPMQFYTALDHIRSSGTSTANIQAQRNVEQEMAAVAPPSSTTSTRAVPFDQMTTAQKREHLRAKGHEI